MLIIIICTPNEVWNDRLSLQKMKLGSYLFFPFHGFSFCLIRLFISSASSLGPASRALTPLPTLGLSANESPLSQFAVLHYIDILSLSLLNYLLNAFESNFNYFIEFQGNFSTILELFTSITSSYFTSLYLYVRNNLKIVLLKFKCTFVRIFTWLCMSENKFILHYPTFLNLQIAAHFSCEILTDSTNSAFKYSFLSFILPDQSS